MNAHLETNFKKGFFLTEEALIKLHDLAKKRLLPTDPAAKIKFKIFRSDGMLVEFDDPISVAAEENSSRNAIKRVEILAAGTSYKLALQFDPKDNTDLRIESNDRDLAYLLYSDLKEYLHAEVLKYRSFTFDSALNSRSVFSIVMLPMFGALLYSLKDSPGPDVIAAVLKSTDVNVKLNFLIEARKTQDAVPIKYAMYGMIGLLVSLFFVGSVLDKLFPRNVFYWGKLAQAHERLLKTREKVVWGVIIAFIIGIASTIAVDFFKTPQKVTSSEQEQTWGFEGAFAHSSAEA
jgi:hypothetical protein